MMHSVAEHWMAEEVREVFDVVRLEYAHSALALILVRALRPTNVPMLKATEARTALGDYWVQGKCALFVPRFKFESAMDLKAALQAMGVEAAFGDGADFGGMVEGGGGLCVSEVVHKAVIEVNEKGTQAAAASAVVMSRCLPPTKRFDYPFTWYIVDMDKKVALFEG